MLILFEKLKIQQWSSNDERQPDAQILLCLESPIYKSTYEFTNTENVISTYMCVVTLPVENVIRMPQTGHIYIPLNDLIFNCVCLCSGCIFQIMTRHWRYLGIYRVSPVSLISLVLAYTFTHLYILWIGGCMCLWVRCKIHACLIRPTR